MLQNLDSDYLLARWQQEFAQTQCATSHTPSWPEPACPPAETPLCEPSSAAPPHRSAYSQGRNEEKTKSDSKTEGEKSSLPPCALAAGASPFWWCWGELESHPTDLWASETHCTGQKTETADSDTQKCLSPSPLLDSAAPPTNINNSSWTPELEWKYLHNCFLLFQDQECVSVCFSTIRQIYSFGLQ